MKILITGGAGFIGTQLTYRLSSAGHDVTVFDCFLPQVHGEVLWSEVRDGKFKGSFDSVKVCFGDVAVARYWKAFEGQEFDVIIHLAAETGTGQSMYRAARYLTANVVPMGIMNDLIADGKLGCKRFVLASSRAVYGDARAVMGTPMPSREADKPDPISVYGSSKLAQENVLFAGFNGVSKVVARLQNVYGPGQSSTNPYTGIIPLFMNLAAAGQTIKVFEDGKMSRDFVYIEDVIKAFETLVYGSDEGIYNVGTGEQTTILDVAETIAEKMGVGLFLTGEHRVGDIRHNYADTTKAKLIGISCDLHPLKMIGLMADHWTGKVNVAEYEASIEEMRGRGLII